MSEEADAIADVILEEFNRLPGNRKPFVRENGLHEWVPLSGIVAKDAEGILTCLAFATGMKCLPAVKLLEANGIVLHDWHAEVLAIRAFNHFLLEECRRLSLGEGQSDFLMLRPRDAEAIHYQQPFAWREDVTLHMYCSEAPCGDASMELTMAAQEDASPWELPTAAAVEPAETTNLPGRAFFSQLGVVRRKPARGDAPQTLSKSCSDKLALKQCTSLLSSLVSLVVCPDNVYLQSLILPESQLSAPACERAFSAAGRMGPVASSTWPGGYSFVPFAVMPTTREFCYSKAAVDSRAAKMAASNAAVAWSRGGLEECFIGGVLQGRKKGDERGAGQVSRKKMWGLAREVAHSPHGDPNLLEAVSGPTYRDVKLYRSLTARQAVKDDAQANALKGWVKNAGDDSFAVITG